MVLLHFLRWLRSNTDLRFVVIVLNRGAMEEEFEEVAPLYHFYSKNPFFKFVRWALRRAGLQPLSDALVWIRNRWGLRSTKSVPLVYLNSAVSGIALSGIPEGPAVVAHVHELEHALSHGMSLEVLNLLLERSSPVIAVAECVRENLERNHAVLPERISVCPEFISLEEIDSVLARPRQRTVRARLAIPEGAMIVGGAGALDWRKGTDLFIQLAVVLRRLFPQQDPHLVWIGGSHSEYEFPRWMHDLYEGRVWETVNFVPNAPDRLEYFREFDVFAVPSREDPLPLVFLEVSAFGIPTVAFSGGGGVPEVIGQLDDKTARNALLSPYLDVESMANQIADLLGSEDLRHRYGAMLSTLVRKHHDVESAGPRLLELMTTATRRG